jgi:hydroxypyruvate reductase
VRELADAIIRTALDAADPKRAMERAWAGVEGACRVVAFGKASRDMLAVVMERCEGRLTEGVIATDQPERVPSHSWLKAMPADHPLSTARNMEAAEAIAACVRGAPAEETLIALVSGGGSAHLAAPMPPITLDDLSALWRALAMAGSTIRELNVVRRHVERYKGGRLASMCRARAIEVFVLSDVMGDSLHDIASGPFAPDPTTFADACRVLEARGTSHVPPAITRHLEAGMRGEHPETPKPGDPIFDRVRHHIIGSNRLCVDAIAAMLEARGIAVSERRYDAQGEAHEWAAWLGERARRPGDGDRPRAWIIGGEPVVRVGVGHGRGGPSQEVALHAARLMAGSGGMMLVALSTDGVDGPTEYAGGVVDGATWSRAVELGLEPEAALAAHESTRVHEGLGTMIYTNPTGTNLNHVAVLVAS